MSKKKTPRPDPASLGLPPAGVDSHAHLDMADTFGEDLPEVLARARAAGVARIGNVFLGPEAYAAGRHLFDAHPEVYFILGIHPNEAAACTPEALEAMRLAFAADARLRAVGEIGLDLYWDDMPLPVQREAFVAQLGLARDLGLPPVIHSRDAFAQTIELLDAEGFAGRPLLWHCFGGDTEQARALLERGWHVSIPGPVSYKKNEELREAVKFMGLSRLLIETDCPYLTPEPWRGTRNEPALVAFTARTIAEALGTEVEEVWRRTGENAARFFGLES
ncbi:hydrolase, TatD family [Desulfovibrio sp. X2]|uniref:TatD family hydrolase n=1 Tax=Desulfovibrio sp. X2 TaxID=941449 RepID=UPI0003587655|nr:TatD family hydrolase [Desulfovibrio sp. X2]EPR41696.1 hydrolase, TatD family [Desulfovibrio sp. X2]